MRENIESWFSRLCDDAKPDVRSRLQSSDDRQFAGAFLELFLHEQLIRNGYTVACHPDVSGGSRRPDFFASNGSDSFYMEARSVSDAHWNRAAANRLAVVYDSLNSLDSPNFFLNVEVIDQGPDPLPTRHLRRRLTSWLADLDPDVLSRSIETAGFDGMPSYSFKEAGWSLRLLPIPKAPAARGDSSLRPIGMYGPGRAFIVDHTTPLREALSDKGKAYGTLDHPFVVALGTSAGHADDWDVMNALYGTEQLQVGRTADGSTVTRSVRAPDGYWYGGSEWKHENVSGVLVVRNLHPAHAPFNVPTLWEHPRPNQPVVALPSWRRAVPGTSRIEYVDASTGGPPFFGLPEPWPDGQPFSN